MNRNQINEFSRAVTQKYYAMLKEMIMTESSQTVAEQSGLDSKFFYIKVIEISSRWASDEAPIWQLMTDMFIGLHSVGAPVSVVFNSDGKKLGVYIGCPYEYVDILKGLLKGVFPQISYERNDMGNLNVYTYSMISKGNTGGGYLKGNPTGSENFLSPYQLDSVIKGMAGLPWNVSIFAKPVGRIDTFNRQQAWLTEASMCSGLTDVSFNETDNQETITYKKNYFHSEQYRRKVEAFSEKLVESTSIGEWCVAVNYSSDSEKNARLLGGLLASAFYGKESEPEPVHTVHCTGNGFNVLVDGMEYTHDSFIGIPHPLYATYLSSKELAVYAAFPTIDTSGFTVKDYVEFDVNREASGDLSIGAILDSGEATENSYDIDSNEFNRHCLVVGLTGSGKTNTVKSLICALTKGKKRPFMIIEPAKKEYWELYKLGYSDLQIYSVGSNEGCAHTFCLNPFERTSYTDKYGRRKSVPIQTHIDFVYAAFKASFIMYTPMPYVLERAIYSIYEDCGWDIHRNINVTGKEVYPTIEDLYFKIPEIVTAMGYDAKMRNDLIGSLQARINSMRLGSKGDTLNVERSFPIDRLLQGNVVIELEDIGDDDVKAFIISLLLVNLLEYRRQQEDSQLEVKHLMLIEEAHRLLKNVQSGTGENADPRGAAVEFFCNLLAELRSKGQGFIVADQIPSKLAPDLIKNTNLKIVHRTVAEEERVLIGGAMHMTDEQIDSLSSLRQGVAAVYSEGDNRPKLVKSRFAGEFTSADREHMSREDVLEVVSANCFTIEGKPEYRSLTDSVPLVCRLCGAHCGKKYTDVLSRIDNAEEFLKRAKWLDPKSVHTCKVIHVDEYIVKAIREHLVCSEDREKDRYCMLGCVTDQWETSDEMKKKLIEAFHRCKGEI